MFARLSRLIAAPEPLPGFRQLMRSALGDYRENWRLLTGIILLVTVPVAIVASLVADPTADTVLSAYLTIANVIMNAALLWAVVAKNRKRATIKQAYYEGSSMLVRTILLGFVFFAIMLPLTLGLLIFNLGITEPSGLMTGAEKLMLGLLAIVLALPSLLLVSQAIFSIFIVSETKQGPIEALKSSRALVGGRLWQVMSRVLALAAVMLLIIALLSTALLGLSAIAGEAWPAIILQILLALAVLPPSTLYLHRLYRELK
ncbi:MAG TPA: hypothetical protein VNA68_00870 [Candidatus Dormibacteraeota bacterium]|nr:hypothetical protein [Candidatus Dormibacteraeota bacterium]